MNVRSQDIRDVPGHDLFVGQIAAVQPLKSLPKEDEEDPFVSAVLMGSREGSRELSSGSNPQHRSFSILMYAAHRGILSLGTHEIDVSVKPLEPETPLEATVFRIVCVSGRLLGVARAVDFPFPEGS